MTTYLGHGRHLIQNHGGIALQLALITLVILYICGVSSIKEFVFPLIVGMLAGVYSSVLLSGQIWAFFVDKQIFAPLTNLFKKNKGAAKKA